MTTQQDYAAVSLPQDDEGPLFDKPWQARAFSLIVHLHRAGLFPWKEWVRTFSDEIKSSPALPGESTNDAYYRQWEAALEKNGVRAGNRQPGRHRAPDAGVAAGLSQHAPRPPHRAGSRRLSAGARPRPSTRARASGRQPGVRRMSAPRENAGRHPCRGPRVRCEHGPRHPPGRRGFAGATGGCRGNEGESYINKPLNAAIRAAKENASCISNPVSSTPEKSG